MRGTSATTLLVLQLKAKGLPRPEFEFRFHPKRRWRFDLAFPRAIIRPNIWPDTTGVAVEIDGGSFPFYARKKNGERYLTTGRHTKGEGFAKDLEKLNMAAELGWRVFRYTPQMIESGAAIEQLEYVLGEMP